MIEVPEAPAAPEELVIVVFRSMGATPAPPSPALVILRETDALVCAGAKLTPPLLVAVVVTLLYGPALLVEAPIAPTPAPGIPLVIV